MGSALPVGEPPVGMPSSDELELSTADRMSVAVPRGSLPKTPCLLSKTEAGLLEFNLKAFVVGIFPPTPEERN